MVGTQKVSARKADGFQQCFDAMLERNSKMKSGFTRSIEDHLYEALLEWLECYSRSILLDMAEKELRYPIAEHICCLNKARYF